PLTTLTLIGVGGTARFARGAMRDVRSQPFVQTAQAKGLSPWQVTHRHVARNALIPVITLLGLSLPALFSSAVLVEAVFAWPGMGRRLVEAVQARDYPVVMAATTVSAILVVLGNLLADAGVALGVGGLAVLLSIAIGVAVGAVAGHWGGPVRTLLLGITDFALALPRVVLLLLLAALWRPNATLVIVVLGVTGWMSVARLVYGEVRSLGVRPFVEGARALGASRSRVLGRHILPNALTPVIVAAALGVGNAIMLEAGLSFLGLGVQPPTPSWGNMIASGRDTLVNAPWVATAPGVALVLVV